MEIKVLRIQNLYNNMNYFITESYYYGIIHHIITIIYRIKYTIRVLLLSNTVIIIITVYDEFTIDVQ